MIELVIESGLQVLQGDGPGVFHELDVLEKIDLSFLERSTGLCSKLLGEDFSLRLVIIDDLLILIKSLLYGGKTGLESGTEIFRL